MMGVIYMLQQIWSFIKTGIAWKLGFTILSTIVLQLLPQVLNLKKTIFTLLICGYLQYLPTDK